ncbi:MAG: hypothetical protein R6V20_10810 [Desulfobia sp.]
MSLPISLSLFNSSTFRLKKIAGFHAVGMPTTEHHCLKGNFHIAAIVLLFGMFGTWVLEIAG